MALLQEKNKKKIILQKCVDITFQKRIDGNSNKKGLVDRLYVLNL